MHGSSVRPSTRHSPADRSDTLWRNRVLLSRCGVSPTCSVRPSIAIYSPLTSLPCMPRVERIDPAPASKRNTFDSVFGLQSVSCISHLVRGALCCSPPPRFALRRARAHSLTRKCGGTDSSRLQMHMISVHPEANQIHPQGLDREGGGRVKGCVRGGIYNNHKKRKTTSHSMYST